MRAEASGTEGSAAGQGMLTEGLSNRQTTGYGYDAGRNTTSITYPLPATASWAATSTVTTDMITPVS
jgi:hypothetical protein